VIGELPELLGAVNETDAVVVPVGDAVIPVGFCGTAGEDVTVELLAELGVLLPTEFVAYTVNVYAVPELNPVTLIGDVDPVAVIPPGEDVTVYDVIAAPPLDTGAVNRTDAVL
jgi:hypothetical protein